jgi:hypothetical protein
MPFFDRFKDWKLLDFLKYADAVKSLGNITEAHRKYVIILEGIIADENEIVIKRKKAEKARLDYEESTTFLLCLCNEVFGRVQ